MEEDLPIEQLEESRIFLSEDAWLKFEKMMEADEEPNENLCRLMQEG